MGGWTNGQPVYDSTTQLNIGNNSDTRLINNNMFEFVISTNGQSDTPEWHQIAQVDINRDPDFTGNNINVTEKVINTIGGSDVPRWHRIVHKDIPATAGLEQWKIPLTFATAGVNMPVEFKGLREYNVLENTHSFNVSINNASGPTTSKPIEVDIPVREDMVVSGNWRTPHTGYDILVKLFGFNVKNYQGVGLMSSKPVIINVPVREQLVSDNHWRIPWQATGDYEISGITTDPATMLIIDEGSWEIVKAEQVTAGAYAITGLQNKTTLVVAAKKNGESLAQGGIDPDQS